MTNEMTWFEPYAGTASVGLVSVGLKPLTNYMGVKTNYAARILEELGGPTPSRLVLHDIGLWGEFWGAVARGEGRDILRELEQWRDLDPGVLYTVLSMQPFTPARFLALQRLNFKGKPVHYQDRSWVLSGLDSTSAYGRKGTDRFGGVNPLLPSTIRKFEALQASIDSGDFIIDAFADLDGPMDMSGAIVYMDPPYQGTQGYPAGDESKEDVALKAVEMSSAGALVGISYDRPFTHLKGARFVNVTSHGSGSRLHEVGRNGNKRDEWLTILPRGFDYQSTARKRLKALRSRLGAES